MCRSFVKRVFPQIMAWAALAVLSTAVVVAQDAATAGGQRTDGQIEMDVVHALDASKALKNDMITAATIQGEVTLTGTVASDASSELAESIAGHVAGVTKVNNGLKVGNPQDAQAADPGAQQPADSQPEEAGAQAPPAPNDGPLPPPSQGQDQDQAQGQAPPPPAYPPVRPRYAPPYPPQGYPPQRQYPQQGQYAQAPPPPQGPVYQQPTGPVTIAQGTLLQLRTSEGLDSKHSKDGQPVEFTVIRDVAVGGVLALPRGATVHGVVSEAKHVGSGDLGGQSYPLDSDQFKVKGPSKTGQTVGNAVGGGILGTIIGCAVGRGVGCAIGAGAGVAAGVGASAASSGPQVWIPAEALVTFHLKTPLTVTPVNAQEAARLAQGLYQGGPSLYRRGPYGYGAQYAGAYPYGYGPVYYRPYYMVGGAYYWR